MMSKEENRLLQEIFAKRILVRNNFIKEAQTKELQDRLKKINEREVKYLMNLRKG